MDNPVCIVLFDLCICGGEVGCEQRNVSLLAKSGVESYRYVANKECAPSDSGAFTFDFTLDPTL